MQDQRKIMNTVKKCEQCKNDSRLKVDEIFLKLLTETELIEFNGKLFILFTTGSKCIDPRY